MGLFEFLKTKGKPAEKITPTKGDRPECDITKTQLMVDLFKIPEEQRDDSWRQTFFDTVQTASYACGDPQILEGPDGFPYFVLQTPEPNKPFKSFCIRNMKDDFLFEKGYGVAINPTKDSVDWVFSYGDIVNLHLNKEFFTKTDRLELQNVEILTKDEKILLAQPSEAYLPKPTRKILKSFLQSIGIRKPGISLIFRTIEGQAIPELAFNIFREDFQSNDQLNYRLKQISWFLPKHYVIHSGPKKYAHEFADL